MPALTVWRIDKKNFSRYIFKLYKLLKIYVIITIFYEFSKFSVYIYKCNVNNLLKIYM